MRLSSSAKSQFSELKVRKEAEVEFDSTVSKLQTELATLPDPRAQYMVFYSLDVVLTVIVLARLGGCTRAEEIVEFWTQNLDRLKRLVFCLPDTVPHPSTIRNILAAIDPVQLNKLVFKRLSGSSHLLTYMAGTIGTDEIDGYHVICADGQAVRSTRRHNKDNPAYNSGVNLVSIFDATTRQTLAQRAVNKKNQETKAIKDCLPELDLNRTVFTFDAINTHADLLSEIVAKGGHYLVSLKKNNGNTYEELEDAFNELEQQTRPQIKTWLQDKPVGYYQTCDSKGGKIISKEMRALPADKALNDDILASWPCIKTVICVETVTAPADPTNKAKPSIGKAYFISDLEYAPGWDVKKAQDKIDRAISERCRILMRMLLQRWGLETAHFYIDYYGTFNQDRHRCFRSKFIENSALLTKLSCNIIATVQEHSVYVYQDRSRCSNRRLPFSKLVRKALFNPLNGVAYLDFYYNNDPEGLYEAGIMFEELPIEEERGHMELYSPEVNDFALCSIFKNGGGRKKPKNTKKKS